MKLPAICNSCGKEYMSDTYHSCPKCAAGKERNRIIDEAIRLSKEKIASRPLPQSLVTLGYYVP